MTTAFRASAIMIPAWLVVWPHTRVACDSNLLLAQCAVQLLNVSVDVSRTTVYVTMSPEVTHGFRTELLSVMHRTYRPTLLLGRRFDVKPFNPNRYMLPRAYLVAARDPFDLANHLDAINVTDASWRPEVNFIVTLETPVEPTAEHALKPVFRRFWNGNVFRSVLLVPRTGRERGTAAAVDALAWYPFRRRCGAYRAPKTVDTCDGGDERKPAGPAAAGGRWGNAAGDVFANRIPATFDDRCTVKIAAFNWPPMTLLSDRTPRAMVGGMDVEVVKLMGRIGRVRLELMEVKDDQRWGVMAANGSWNGGFGELSEHRVDFLIGGGIMTAERMERFGSAPARQVIRFPLYTPPSKRLPYWQNTLNVFSAGLWLTLFAVFVLTSGLLWLSGVSLPSERRAFADAGHCLVVSWAVLCGVASGRPPATASSKLIYLAWTVYALHISAVYTSMQLIYLYKPKFERPMRTIDDVKESGLLVCSVPTFIPIARAMSAENFNLTAYTPCADMVSSANRLLRHKDIIILDPEDHFEALVWSSTKKVNKLDEVVIVYNIGIYMQKGNPYRTILARAQIAAYESGLHDKWRQNASPPRRSRKNNTVKVKMLNADELQGAFIVLTCGLCAGLVVFLFEWFFGPS